MTATTSPDGKRFATLQALAALHGYSVSSTTSDAGCAPFQAARWGLLREFDTLADLEQWLRAAGVEVPR